MIVRMDSIWLDKGDNRKEMMAWIDRATPYMPAQIGAEDLAFDTETETLFCTLLYGGGVTADTTVSVGSRPPFVPEDV